MTRSLSSDPRAERVRSALLGAAFELAHQRRIEDISVSDLVRQAGVSRPVFYKHFADRDEAVTAAVRASLDETLAGAVDDHDRLDRFLRWSRAHPTLNANLYPSHVAQRLADHVREVLLPLCRRAVAAATPPWDAGMRDRVVQFLVGGLLELLRQPGTNPLTNRLTAGDYLDLVHRLARSMGV